jgi:hypothetical protein
MAEPKPKMEGQERKEYRRVLRDASVVKATKMEALVNQPLVHFNNYAWQFEFHYSMEISELALR